MCHSTMGLTRCYKTAVFMAVLYVVEVAIMFYGCTLLFFFFSNANLPRLLNGFHSYFHTISGLGVI